MTYLIPILSGFATCLILTAVLAFPYMLYQYYKLGSLIWQKVFIQTGFLLYLICAFYLVILPLPTRSAVAAMTGPTMQWIPLSFIADFFKETVLVLTQPATHLPALRQGVVLQPLFNILLTLPFGIWLRLWFNKDAKHTVLFTFLLSLFFELTQLSGLWFIYPRAYRLFDVDDLLLNTLGGWLGYLCAPLLKQLFPSRNTIRETALVRSEQVSLLRRLLTFGLDYTVLNWLARLLVHTFHLPDQMLMIQGIIWMGLWIEPTLMKGRTISMLLTHLSIEGKPLTTFKLILRTGCFIFFVNILPLFLDDWFNSLNSSPHVDTLSMAMVLGLMLSYDAVLVLHFVIQSLRHQHVYFYEHFSGTTIVSTFQKDSTLKKKD